MTEVVGALVPNLDMKHMILVPLEGTFLWRVFTPWGVHMIVSWVTISCSVIGSITSRIWEVPSPGFLALSLYIFLTCMLIIVVWIVGHKIGWFNFNLILSP